jgi:PTH1 family peptidyl-tRNA hydrolase
MENLHLIVGLGNPGADYERTRHNAGFLVAERLAERWKARWTEESKFSGSLAKAQVGEQRIILCRPLTYMNLSGEAVAKVSKFYQIPIGRVLVVVDDADLPFGQIRLRADGSSGGHHGLDSIEQHLGSRQYARQRVGIGRQTGGVRQIAGYVLGRFSSAEWPDVEKILDKAADQIECWLTAGVGQAMNRFNGVVSGIATGKTE